MNHKALTTCKSLPKLTYYFRTSLFYLHSLGVATSVDVKAEIFDVTRSRLILKSTRFFALSSTPFQKFINKQTMGVTREDLGILGTSIQI